MKPMFLNILLWRYQGTKAAQVRNCFQPCAVEVVINDNAKQT